MTEDNVIHAFQKPELPEQTLIVAPPPLGKPHYCNHTALSIDAHERSVTCAQCSQVLDPFNFLLNNALVLQRAWQDHAQVTRSLREMQDRITAMKKEEQRMRARVSRLKSKVEVVDVRGKPTL